MRYAYIALMMAFGLTIGLVPTHTSADGGNACPGILQNVNILRKQLTTGVSGSQTISATVPAGEFWVIDANGGSGAFNSWGGNQANPADAGAVLAFAPGSAVSLTIQNGSVNYYALADAQAAITARACLLLQRSWDYNHSWLPQGYVAPTGAPGPNGVNPVTGN